MQNAKSCLIPNYIYFNPSKQFVSSGKLFYREIKQSQQLKRVQPVSTNEHWERDYRRPCIETQTALPICAQLSLVLCVCVCMGV